MGWLFSPERMGWMRPAALGVRPLLQAATMELQGGAAGPTNGWVVSSLGVLHRPLSQPWWRLHGGYDADAVRVATAAALLN